MNFIDKIFTWTKKNAVNKILDTYKKRWYLVINFIYFASLNKYILEWNNLEYQKALNNSDIILPDWIALKIYLKYKKNIKIKENLNGTDFTPFFLNSLKNKKLHIWFYTVYDEKIWKKPQDADKVEKILKEKYKPLKIFKFVNHYKNRGKWFDFENYKKSLKGNYDYKIFLVGLWTPFQEVWVEENKDFFKKNNIIVLNVWGLFDFRAGFEKRAPKIVRNLNLEWAWRLWQNPKKNWNKVKESFKLLKHLIKK